MKGAKLPKIGLVFMTVAVILILGSAFTYKAYVKQLSLDFTSRTLFQGKSVTAKGTLFYRVQDGHMVTRIASPIEQLVISKANGELKNYDVRTNTVAMMMGQDFSSRNSFIYSFLSGKTSDMGLGEIGYKLTDTRNEDESIVVNTYMAPMSSSFKAQKVEIAFNNYLPIYLGFHDFNDKTFQKTYYTNYQTVGYTQMPLTITEIEFLTEVDSSITQRKYSNLLTNGNVMEQWLNFEIPADAKIVDDTSMPQLDR